MTRVILSRVFVEIIIRVNIGFGSELIDCFVPAYNFKSLWLLIHGVHCAARAATLHNGRLVAMNLQKEVV